MTFEPTRVQNLMKNYSQSIFFSIYVWLERSITIEIWNFSFKFVFPEKNKSSLSLPLSHTYTHPRHKLILLLQHVFRFLPILFHFFNKVIPLTHLMVHNTMNSSFFRFLSGGTLCNLGFCQIITMAALQPSAGGQLPSSPTFQRKSFSKLFSSQSSQPILSIKTATSTHKGEPTINFSQDAIDILSHRYRSRNIF